MARRRPRPARRAQAGVSLIEVLAAMAVFAIVAAGMALFTATAMRFNAENRAAGAAHMLAESELEQQRALEYVDIAPRMYTTSQGGRSFVVNTAVLSDTPASGMKDITVTVTWAGPLGTRRYALETIFTDID